MSEFQAPSSPQIGSIGDFLRFLLSEMKPKGKLITPFNVISSIIVAVGLVLIVIRFVYGIGSITNLDLSLIHI